MYIMPIINVLLRFPLLSKCFGKMDSGSKEWDDLYKYLSKGDKFMDLDFKNFDISHIMRLIREVARFFFRLAMLWYKNEEAARVVYGLIFALSCQLFEHKNDFALKYKGLPSGHIITLILNSIINILLMMVAFDELCPGMNFFDEVFPATVGDDNISGISFKVADRFNLVTITPVYSRMGYTVTDATKSEVVSPFVDPSNMQFVKRRFRYEPLIEQYVAPLEEDSIYKMLSYWTFKNEAGSSYTERMSQCLDVAQREMFLHGRKKFDDFVHNFKDECDKIELYVYWYSFDELLDKYKSGKEMFMNW